MSAIIPPAEITSEVHVYRFKVTDAGSDTPTLPGVPGLVGHASFTPTYITPVRGKVNIDRNGAVGQIEFQGPRVDNGQRHTALYTREDLSRGDYHGTIPRLVFNIVEQIKAHHLSVMKEVQP